MIATSQLEIVAGSVENLDEKDIESLLLHYPFDNLLNISVLDFQSFRLHLTLLKKICKLDTFYNRPEPIKNCWEFVLMNIMSLENIPADDILIDLLYLLKYFISRIKLLKKFLLYVRNDSERLFNVLTFAAKLEIFSKLCVPHCTDIIKDLVDLNDTLPSTTSKNLVDIAKAYKELEVVHELVILCDICFKKFTPACELFFVCMSWLLAKGSGLLENDDDTVLWFLKVVNELQTNSKYTENIQVKKFISSVRAATHNIVFLSGKPSLREEGLKFLATLICEYKFLEMGVTEDYTIILNKLLQLSADINQWPDIKSDIFFYICTYLCTYSRLPWNSSAVLKSISRFIYSYNRFTITPELLKILCWIYSIAITDAQSKKTILLGDELLILLSKFPYSFSKVLTYHIAQLVWILKRRYYSIKKRVLVEWLRKGMELEILAKAITLCKVGDILLDIISDRECDELSYRVIELCHKIEDRGLLENIACIIPTALHNRHLMAKLILANPGIPENPEVALQICEFMSLVFCLIEDETVLRAACVYTRNLVKYLRRQSNVISLFCRNLQNIKFLIIKVKYVNEETAVEILRLLKNLVLIQKRNHSVLEDQVDADLAFSLAGCENKMEKSLDLLQLMVTSKDIFIKLENSKISNMFTKLFDLSQNPRLAVRSFICLTNILKANQWLAQVHSTNIFIEIQCGLSAKKNSGPEFLTFLILWMKILNNYLNVDCLYIPDKRVLSNYIKRCNYISQIKERRLLRMLDKI